MYCPHCGTVLSDTATLCTSCGGAVKKDSVEFVPPKKSMRWYGFLIYVGAWLAAAAYGYLGFTYVVTEHPACGIAFWVLGAFCIAVRFLLAGKRACAPVCFYILCMATAVLAVACSWLAAGYPDFAGLFCDLAFGVIFTLLHYIYFEKRSLYFQK